jgi:hypothetical protein
MMKVMRVLPTAVLLAAGSVSTLSGAQAQGEYRGTPAQQRACRPDVFRLCAAEIPNVRAITRCLENKMSRLSPDCRAVFENRTQ